MSAFNTWFLGRPEIADFWGLGGPNGPNNPSRRWKASPPNPHLFDVFLGPPGPPRPHIDDFLPAPKTMY
jgi:hypothetical protein